MKRNIYIIGETTYDIIFKNNKPIDAKVGGSQLNTAVSLGRLGLPVTFISIFGNDKVGKISDDFLKENSVKTDHVALINDNSRIALAFLNDQNDAEYTFFKPAVEKIELKFPDVNENDIVLFGSSFAINSDIRGQLRPFLEKAKKAGALIVYDPNFRKPTKSSLEQLKPIFIENFKFANLVKGSDEDFTHIFETDSSHETYCYLAEYFAQNLIYTAGADNVHLHTLDYVDEFPVPQIEPVSTIGAGDNFNAGMVYSLYKLGVTTDSIDNMSMKNWEFVIENAIKFSQNVCLGYDNYISGEFAEGYL